MDQTTLLFWLRKEKLSSSNHGRSFGERIMSSHPKQMQYKQASNYLEQSQLGALIQNHFQLLLFIVEIIN
jgi:hypothetical protein